MAPATTPAPPLRFSPGAPQKTEGADIHHGTLSRPGGRASHRPTSPFCLARTRPRKLRLVGNCDSGYSCAYSNSIAWRSETTPLPPEVNPRAVFERLFGDGENFDPNTRAVKAR
ncbi:MAG: DUF1552 domain-containing protein [Paludibaculum sp.]